MKRIILGVLLLAALVAAWVVAAGTNYQEDRETITVNGVKCEGMSRCYEPVRVGTAGTKIPLWEFKGEGYSKAETAIDHISIFSELIVDGTPIDSDAKEADNSSFLSTSGYGTGGSWYEVVYRSEHDFVVNRVEGRCRTEAGYVSKK